MGITIAGGGLVMLFYPKLITGDFADITITKVTVAPNGQVALSMATISSRGTPVVNGFYDGNKYLGGGWSSGGGSIGRPSSGIAGFNFDLNPERAPTAGRAEDAPWFRRLLVHQGDQQRLHGGERLYFYDFLTSDGIRHDGYVEVKSTLKK